MKLSELKKIIEFELEYDPSNADKKVTIKILKKSMNPSTDSVDVKDAGFGIDWDSHQFIISPVIPLTTPPKDKE